MNGRNPGKELARYECVSSLGVVISKADSGTGRWLEIDEESGLACLVVNQPVYNKRKRRLKSPCYSRGLSQSRIYIGCHLLSERICPNCL